MYILNKQHPNKEILKITSLPSQQNTGFTFLTPLRKFCPQNLHTRLRKDKDNGSS